MTEKIRIIKLDGFGSEVHTAITNIQRSLTENGLFFLGEDERVFVTDFDNVTVILIKRKE